MLRLIVTRCVQFPLILAAIYLVTFLLAWVAPGSPFEGERSIDPAVKKALQEKFHADKPLSFLLYYPKQALLHGDLGDSFQHKGWSVGDIIWTSLPVSVTLGLFAIVLALFGGVGIGTLAAVRRGGALDWLSLSVSLLGISVPSFVTAALLLLASASGWLSGVFAVGRWSEPIDVLLPGVALSLAPMAYIARLTRVSMLDVLQADFVRTARAKGVNPFWVVWKHCLRNAILPVLSYLGPAAAVTLTGSFVVERVFKVPGLGDHFVNSVTNRDQTMILGVVMVYSVFLLSFNLIVDVLYALVDPRIDVGATVS